jgi:hypothetical protein
MMRAGTDDIIRTPPARSRFDALPPEPQRPGGSEPFYLVVKVNTVVSRGWMPSVPTTFQ